MPGAMEDRGWGRKDPGCYGGCDGGRRGAECYECYEVGVGWAEGAQFREGQGMGAGRTHGAMEGGGWGRRGPPWN